MHRAKRHDIRLRVLQHGSIGSDLLVEEGAGAVQVALAAVVVRRDELFHQHADDVARALRVRVDDVQFDKAVGRVGRPLNFSPKLRHRNGERGLPL